MYRTLKILSLMTLSVSTLAIATPFSLSSNDIAQGEYMSKAQEFQGFGCSGDNISPQLSWSLAPEGTKSFAITAFDPDAPTGSGWWHWQVVNIPKHISQLSSGAGDAANSEIPSGSTQISNDYGSQAYGGACPPIGHGVHRYRFTVHALSVETLELPSDASGALAGYMINANTIASSSIEALYKRE
ncbi:YbhB/YbcL family Raf kinase inhibitor-like protein [Alginatibacterium sediminis]|uniref:YbhB/YbcL family Raf kinase inhibitor-like protein n=1 Tax=Alginatibacterium sediminis TaxID=2164068 RepID=A0A420EBH4_9ALTE|nr:YbhB/YbcL family Raf kinase inhibitor-like protein [Alginatibacterium sediminis]RKF18047.1 YbhB/YbcL family Raf kinase inhibitor-like protein [Alginatibacterium sediminis]